MSRRREAAELQRALALSTQDASHLAALSPHSLSSPSRIHSSGSKHTCSGETPSSREMELRPADVGPMGALDFAHRAIPPMTVRPGDVMGPPSSSSHGITASGSRSGSSGKAATGSDPIVSQGTGRLPNIIPSSAIDSFTPSRQKPSTSVVVPASSSHAHSSASRINSSTSSSSHRPIFSPTQISNVPSRVASTAGGADSGSQPPRRDTKTYGRQSRSPEKASAAPTAARHFTLSPSPPAGPSRVRNLSEAEMAEPVEPLELPEHDARTPSKKRKVVEVVLTTKDRSKSRSNDRPPNERDHSPDPLDSFASRSPVRPHPASSMSLASTDDGSRRSSRVAQKKEDEERLKEERRAKRRAEKEAKLRAEQDAPEAEVRAPTAEKAKKQREVIVIDDESQVGPVIVPPTVPEVAEAPAKPEKSKRKKAADGEEEEDWNPKAKKKDRKKKEGKAKKAAPVKVVDPDEEPEEVEAASEPMMATLDPSALTAETSQPDLSHSATTDSQPKGITPAPADSEVDKENTVSVAETSQTPSAKSMTPASAGEGGRKRPLDRADTNRPSPAPSYRPSPGPMDSRGIPQAPGGIRWKTTRDDLGSVLAKFAPVRPTGMSKRLRIAPLHMKIGTPVKALPPVPKKPSRKKEDSDEEEEEEEAADGVRKVKPGSKEWLMMED